MATYQSVHLVERPTANIIPGQTFKIQTHAQPSIQDLQDGEVIIRTLYLSIDPAMRGWIDNKRSYLQPVEINEVMRGFGIARVVVSKSQSFPDGTLVLAKMGWTEVAKLHESVLEKASLPEAAQLTDLLGVLGMTAMTAYFGITDIGQVRKGDLVIITGAAGATGCVAGQIAKIQGATVVGIAGSDEKCQWLVEELGFDEALNYKADGFRENFQVATDSLIDVFFDNVGGGILDMALERAKPHARFVMCGAVSVHNGGSDTYGLKNYIMVTRMRIKMQGFIIFDYTNRFTEAREQLSQWLADRRLRRGETILTGGLQQAERALIGLYEGINTGKLLVEVNAESAGESRSSIDSIRLPSGWSAIMR